MRHSLTCHSPERETGRPPRVHLRRSEQRAGGQRSLLRDDGVDRDRSGVPVDDPGGVDSGRQYPLIVKTDCWAGRAPVADRFAPARGAVDLDLDRSGAGLLRRI